MYCTPTNVGSAKGCQRCVTKINGGRRERGCAVSSQDSTSRLGDRDRNIKESGPELECGSVCLSGGVVSAVISQPDCSFASVVLPV